MWQIAATFLKVWNKSGPTIYLSHEVGEKEHVAEEGRPPQQVTDTQVAVVVGHADNGFHQRPEGHPFLGLPTHVNDSLCKGSSTDKIKTN